MSETELNTQLFVAIKENDVDLAKKLLAGGVNVNTIIEPKLYQDTNVGIASHFEGVVPLHFAVIKGNKEMVEVLLNNGADVNAAMILTKGGRRIPLYLAVETKNLEIAELLLERKANIEAKVIDSSNGECIARDKGCTPLHCAIAIGDLAMARLLFEHGANVNAKIMGSVLDEKGIKLVGNSYTTLHIAIEKKNLDAIKLLLDNEADPNIKVGLKMYTPLHFAIEKGHLDVVKFLLDNKADINVKDKDGKTPLCYAVEKNKIDIAELIVKHIVKLEAADLHVRPEDLQLKAELTPTIEKRIFIHNHKPLIDALLKLGYNGDNTHDSIKIFLEANKDKLKVKVGVQDKTLSAFVDFEDIRERHVPKLEFCAFAEAVKNQLDNPKTDQHQAAGPAIN